MSKRKQVLIFTVAFILTFFLLTFPASISWSLHFVVVGIVNLTFIAYNSHLSFFASQRSRYYAALGLVLPYTVIMTVMCIFYKLDHMYFTILVSISMISFGILVSETERSQNKIKYVLSLSILVLILGIVVHPNYLVYTFTPSPYVSFAAPSQAEITDVDGNPVSIYSSNKVKVIDVWTTSCGICFKKFPEFEKLTNKLKTDNSVIFYSMNVRLPHEKFSEVVEVAKQNVDYDFANLFGNQEFQKLFKIEAYPKIIIIDRNNIVRYVGPLNTSLVPLIYNPTDLINKFKHT